MEDRLAVISCIISDPQSVSVMNEKLHLHASMIIARLGVPCREYGVSVVSVVLHGLPAVIHWLSPLRIMPNVPDAYKELVGKYFRPWKGKRGKGKIHSGAGKQYI